MFNKLHFNNINTLELQIRNTLRKKIYYWSPSVVNIATNTAVINSAFSIKKYSKIFDAEIINFFGEFDRYDKNIKSKETKIIKYGVINFMSKRPEKFESSKIIGKRIKHPPAGDGIP